MKRTLGSCLLALCASFLLAGGARADDAFRSARVSDLRGNLSVRGVDEDDYSYLQRNAVVREGDTLWTDETGRAEVELERGSWLRLAEDTKLEIRHLSGSADLRLWTGSLYVDASDRLEEPVHVSTPAGSVDVDPNSVVRVDLSKEDSTRVSVFSGRAFVAGSRGGRIRVSNGRRIYLEPDREIEEAAAFNRDDRDDFDAFQRERVDYYISRPVPRSLEREIIGARELDDYGSWVEVEHVSYWRPRCEPDWRPYSTGYWSYVPACGYSWVDYSPWGYTTCHYGRWMWQPSYGWLWCPGYAWAPAYVSWSTCGNYYGWCPLDPWDRPACYGGGTFISIGFGIDSRSWTFCDRDRFFYGRHHPWYNGGRSVFVTANHIDIHNNFTVVRNFNREIGVPRERVRGITVARDGSLARDHVLRVENRIPERRLQLIARTFNEDAMKDRTQARRPSAVESFQRNPAGHLDLAQHVVRGEEADRRQTFRPTVNPGRPAVAAAGGREAGSEIGRRGGSNGTSAGSGGTGEPGRRNGGEISGSRRGNEPAAGSDPRDRDSGFRRNGALNRDGGADRSGARGGDPGRNGDRTGARTGDTVRPGERGGDRSGDRTGTPGRDRSGEVTRSGRTDSGDRDSGFRRNGGGSREGTPAGAGYRSGDRQPDRGSNAGHGAAPGRTPDRGSYPSRTPDRGTGQDRGYTPNRSSAPDRSPAPDRSRGPASTSPDRRPDDPRRTGGSSSSEGPGSHHASTAPDYSRGGAAYGGRSVDRQPRYQDFPYPAGYSSHADRDSAYRHGGADSSGRDSSRGDSGAVFGRSRGGVDGTYGGSGRSYDRGGNPGYGAPERGSYRSPSPGYSTPSRSSYGGERGSYGGGSYHGGAPSGGAPSGGAPSGGSHGAESRGSGPTGGYSGGGSYGGGSYGGGSYGGRR